MINRSLLKGNLATPYPALKPCPSLITWRRPSCRQLITKSPLESIFSSPRWKLVIEHPSKNLLLSTKHYCSLRDITILLWTRFGVARGGGQHLCSLASEGFLFCSLAPGFLFLFLFFLTFYILRSPVQCTETFCTVASSTIVLHQSWWKTLHPRFNISVCRVFSVTPALALAFLESTHPVSILRSKLIFLRSSVAFFWLSTHQGTFWL